MKAHIHAESSAKQFGGKPEDYLAIHEFMDCSKGVIADHRHRALTHNTWFIMHVLPRVFRDTIKNSKGKKVSVREIGEQHVLEDFRGKFIPSAQDFLQVMDYEEWMNNGNAYPASHPKGRKPTQELRNKQLPTVPELTELTEIPDLYPIIPTHPKWPFPNHPGRPEVTDHIPYIPGSGTLD